MANTGYILPSGKRGYLLADPSDTVTLESPASSQISDFSTVFTASGGAISVEATAIRKKYPWVSQSTNSFKTSPVFDRFVSFGETVTVTASAGLIQDAAGSTSAAFSSTPITNYSYYHDNASELLSNSTPIAFVDKVNGDDSTARLMFKTDTEVGTNIEDPDGTPLAFKTSYAAMRALRGELPTDAITGKAVHGAIGYKGGQTVDGADDFFQSGNNGGIVCATGGTAHGTPFVVFRWGTGDATLQGQQAAGSGTGRAITFAGNRQFFVVSRGIRLIGGVDSAGNPATALRFGSSDNTDRFGYLFLGCRISDVTMNVAASSTVGFFQRMTCFVDCTFGREGTSGNGGILSCDERWHLFCYREMDFINCSFDRSGSGGQFQGLYMKSFGDAYIYEPVFYNLGGTPIKCDGNWGVEVVRPLYISCNDMGNIEVNGPQLAGVQINRLKDPQTTEYPTQAASNGGFSKWVSIHDGIFSDPQTGRFGDMQTSAASGLTGTMGQSEESEFVNNLGVFNTATQVTAFAFTNQPGGGSTAQNGRDQNGLVVENNTVVLSGALTSACYGASFTMAENDDFSVSSGNRARGIHDLSFQRNIIWFKAGMPTGSQLFRFWNRADHDFQTGSLAGRIDGDWNYNLFYDGTGYTNKYRNGGTASVNQTYSSIGALQTAINGVVSGTMTGNAEDDPAFIAGGYDSASAYIASLDYSDMDEWYDALEAGIRTGTRPVGCENQDFARALYQEYTTSGLSVGDFGGILPGATDWTTPDDPAAAGDDIRFVSYGSGSSVTPDSVVRSDSPLVFPVALFNLGDEAGTLGTVSVLGAGFSIEGASDPSDEEIASLDGLSFNLLIDRSTGGDKGGFLSVPVVDGDTLGLGILQYVRSGQMAVTTDGEEAPADPIVYEVEQNDPASLTLVYTNTGDATMTSIDVTLPTGVTLAAGSTEPLSLGEGLSRSVTYDIATGTIQTATEKTISVAWDGDGGTPTEINLLLTVTARSESQVWYIQTGATGGDGSETAPYASLSELFTNETLVPGDLVYVDTPDTPHLGTVTLTTVDGLTITRWPGKAQPKFRNVALIEFPDVYDSTGTFDILATSEATYAADPTELIQDPETHDANGLKCQGDGAGFLVAATGANFAAKVVNMKATAGLWARDSGKLYISVPKGDRNADHLWYRALTGMLFQTSGACSDLVLEDLDLAYACETSTTQRGNLIDVAGDIDGMTVRNCNIQVGYYHHFVSRGNDTNNVDIDSNLFGVARGQNDGICTLYAGTDFGTGCTIRNNTMYGYVWRDTSGAAYKANNGVVKGYGHHHVGTEMAAGSLKVYNNTFRKDPGVATAQHQAFSVTAGGCNHDIPADITDFSQYAVQVYDNDFEGAIHIGSSPTTSDAASEICVAMRRNYCWGDFTGVVDQTGMLSSGHVSNTAGGSVSVTRALYESCVMSYETANVSARAVLALTDFSATVGVSDLQVYCKNCTLYNERTVAPASPNYLVNNASSGDGLTVTQCVLDAGYAIVPIGGNETPANQTWTRNWYSSGMSNTMHAPTGTNRATWLSTYDTVGKYTDNPGFVDTQTGQPDAVGKAIKAGGTSGPDGINLSSVTGKWSDNFGAWQFGAVGGNLGGGGAAAAFGIINNKKRRRSS